MSAFLYTQITGSLPQKLTSSGICFTEATFYGFSGFVSGMGLLNNSTVHIGVESGRLPIQLLSGQSVRFPIFTPNASVKECLGNLWVKSTSGNGVCVIYN